MAQAADGGVPVNGASRTGSTSEALLAAILSDLQENKAEDIVQIDLRGKSAIGDYMIVCSGRSTRQVTAIAEKLVDTLKSEPGVLSSPYRGSSLRSVWA